MLTKNNKRKDIKTWSIKQIDISRKDNNNNEIICTSKVCASRHN